MLLFPAMSWRRRLPYLLCSLSILIFHNNLFFAGDQQWVEVRSPNFSVITDSGEKRGREVAMRFEQMRGVFGALIVKAHVNLAVPLQIVAFRNSKELRQFAPLFNSKPTQVAGLFQGGSDRCFIMLDMSVENPWTVVFHEYAHQLLNGNMEGSLDPWFEEGFAEYFSSIEVDGKEAKVGKVPKEEYIILQQAGMMKISDLFKVRQNTSTYNENGDHRNTFYAESGMLMHYIYDNQLLPKVASYYTLRDQHVSVEDAIQRGFGWSAQQFDKNLRDYVSVGRYRYYSIANPPGMAQNAYTVDLLSATNANAVLADIHLHSIDYQQQAVEEFQQILKADPNNGAACRGLGYAYLERRDFAHAAEYFDRASQLDSKDPRVHYYNALLTAQRGSVSDASATVIAREAQASIALDPNFADSYALLAFAQSTMGDSSNALAAMQKAVSISPQNQPYLFNLANLYFVNRQPEKAISVLQSLQFTDNVDIATRAAQLLAEARQMDAALKSGNINPAPALAVQPGAVVETNSHAGKSEASGGASGVMNLPAKPAKFLQGTLTGSDCSSPPAISLTIVSGTKTFKLKVWDRKRLALIGADEFSCSWKDRKVAVNYMENTDGLAVISLELQ